MYDLKRHETIKISNGVPGSLGVDMSGYTTKFHFRLSEKTQDYVLDQNEVTCEIDGLGFSGNIPDQSTTTYHYVGTSGNLKTGETSFNMEYCADSILFELTNVDNGDVGRYFVKYISPTMFSMQPTGGLNEIFKRQ
jgi:hypothetical protein